MYLHVSIGEGPGTGTGPRTDPQGATPTGPATKTLRTMRQAIQSFGPGKTWSTRDLIRALKKPASWIAPALDELEERGYIEHDPKSMRKYRGVMAPKRYTTLSLGEDPAPERQPGED